MEHKDLEIIKEGKTGHGLLIENDGYVSLDMPNNKVLKESFGDVNGEWHCPKPFIISCVLQKCGIKNANGRVYPEDILRREIQNYQTLVKERRALGELDHPSDSTISLQKISHNIVELHWEKNTVVGKLELNISEGYRRYGIVTTMGDQAANLVLQGFKIGISSRAVGSVENKLGVMMVGDDLELLGWDLVSNPSTPMAWLSNDNEEIATYIESDTTKKNKTQIQEKINKLKGLLD